MHRHTGKWPMWGWIDQSPVSCPNLVFKNHQPVQFQCWYIWPWYGKWASSAPIHGIFAQELQSESAMRCSRGVHPCCFPSSILGCLYLWFWWLPWFVDVHTLLTRKFFWCLAKKHWDWTGRHHTNKHSGKSVLCRELASVNPVNIQGRDSGGGNRSGSGGR